MISRRLISYFRLILAEVVRRCQPYEICYQREEISGR